MSEILSNAQSLRYVRASSIVFTLVSLYKLISKQSSNGSRMCACIDTAHMYALLKNKCSVIVWSIIMQKYSPLNLDRVSKINLEINAMTLAYSRY